MIVIRAVSEPALRFIWADVYPQLDEGQVIFLQGIECEDIDFEGELEGIVVYYLIERQ